ncbi:hypothetical protein CL655_03670 [bacterium]|nr:hypothetical protein [bacterium]
MYIFCTVCHIFSMNERIYLDWAAATPLLPLAKAAMEPYLTELFGNPSAIHQEGQRARDAVEAARTQVARALQVRPELVTWTSGGTEGNNLAILGVVEAVHAAGRAYTDMAVVTTKIEHPSVGLAMEALAQRGVEVRCVSVGETGKIDLTHLNELLDERVVLMSTAYANSEIGTIEPVHAIRKQLNAAEAKHQTHIYFHLDAAQAPLWLTCQFDSLGADLVTLDATKCCGPKGVGVLVRSRRVELAPTIFGGGQEQGLRPGTENVASIVGAAKAIEWAQADWRERSESVGAVRNTAVTHLLEHIPQAVLNGAPCSSGERLANNINISIPGLDTEYATVVLDTAGFAVSTKSACSGAGGGASTVVQETTGDPARASATLRITLGPDSTPAHIQSLTEVLKKHIEKMEDF